MTYSSLEFSTLRDKWKEIPQEGGRVFSDQLLQLDQSTLFASWQQYFARYRSSEPDRWYQTLYKEFMRGKRVLEIGAGLGFDGTLRLQEGLVKEWTFCDIAETNLQIIERICKQLGVQANFVFIDDNFECFDKLGMFDVIWANGSLLHVPFEFARTECLRILPHLTPGGRWIELCYPRQRWIREGRPPFSEWGKMTDGERTPWVEWYDLVKMRRRLFPAPLEVVLDFNFHNDIYNWFDLMLASDRPFDPTQAIFDVDIFPSGSAADKHGDTMVLQADSGLVVTTPEQIWSYAVSFDLSGPMQRHRGDRGQHDGGFTVEIDLLVSRGHVGALLVAEDVSAPVHHELMAPAGTEPTTLMISVPPNTGARRLIFRNAASNMRSEFTLERLKLRFVDKTSGSEGAEDDEQQKASTLNRFFAKFR